MPHRIPCGEWVVLLAGATPFVRHRYDYPASTTFDGLTGTVRRYRAGDVFGSIAEVWTAMGYLEVPAKLLQPVPPDTIAALPDKRDYLDLVHAGRHNADFRRRVQAALIRRIEGRGGVRSRGRRDEVDYQARLVRDAGRVHNRIERRVIVRRFETAEIAARYAYLLTRPEDE